MSKKTNNEDEQADFVYVNMNIASIDPVNSINAVAQQNRTDQILYEADKYYGTIERFQLGGIALPLVVPLIQPPPNNDVNLTQYGFCLGYSNGEFSPISYVEYVTSNLAAPIPTSTSSLDISNYYYYIFSYQVFLDMWNTALQTAYTALETLVGPPLTPGKAPFFYFDQVKQNVILQVDETLYNSANTNHITIYFNGYIVPYLTGFTYKSYPSGFANNCENGLVIGNYTYNVSGSNLLVTNDNNQQLCFWNTVSRILVKTTMPINYEYISPITGQTNNNSSTDSIMFDFIPDTSQVGVISTKFIYNKTDSLRMWEYTTKSSLQRFDFSVWWSDNYGREALMQVFLGESISMKILNIKKSVYANRSGAI